LHKGTPQEVSAYNFKTNVIIGFLNNRLIVPPALGQVIPMNNHKLEQWPIGPGGRQKVLCCRNCPDMKKMMLLLLRTTVEELLGDVLLAM